MTPAASAQAAARRRLVVATAGVERSEGFSLLALPLSSGYTLAFRRCITSSIGPPHTCVWQRDPLGRWTCFVDVVPERSCVRHFRPALHAIHSSDIDVIWKNADELVVFVHAVRLHLRLRLGTSIASRSVSALLRLLPAPLWRHPGTLGAVGRLAGTALGSGPFAFHARTPAGSQLRMRPRALWHVRATAVTRDGHDLGELAAARELTTLGELVLPPAALFAVGEEEYVMV